jgi:ABC-type glutathione transport system ATPase component
MTTDLAVLARERAAAADPQADPVLLRVEDLTVTYGSGEGAHVAVRGASFALRRGERVAVVGESGSGKTTMGLAVAGLLTAPAAVTSAAEIVFAGRPLERGPARKVPVRTPGLSMVFQDAMTSLDPVASIGSQFTAVLRGVERLSRRAARERAAQWLVRVGLTDTARVLKLRPYELSGGMRQRVMVALAMCGRPALLVADEPTSALDASVSRDVMDLLVRMTEEEGASLLIITHDIELCRQYTDRMIVLYRGEIVDVCATERIEQEATNPYTRALLSCVPTLDAADLERLPTLGEFVPEAAAGLEEAPAGTAAA